MVPGADHAEVSPGRPAAVNVFAQPFSPIQPRKVAQRDAWRRHLQNDLRTYPPALTDPRFVDLEVQRGEVLAEETIRELAPEPSLPLVEVLTLEGVDGLIRRRRDACRRR